MKKITLTIICSLAVCWTQAQTWNEWFRQSKTQKKYLIQQIAALKGYIEVAQKGYKIAKEGLDFIGDMKRGEFNLHDAFFNSLQSINPEIRKYYKVAEIVGLQSEILKNCAETKRSLRNSGMMQADELEYVTGSFNRMLENCSDLVAQLITLTTSGKLELTDDQRIRRIDEVHQQMQDNYTFTKSFGDQALILAISRKQESNDLQTSRALNGINK